MFKKKTSAILWQCVIGGGQQIKREKYMTCHHSLSNLI